MIRFPAATSLSDHETSTAREAVMNATWIAHDDARSDSDPSWKACPTLGLDTEFVRERTYYPKPGLVQISDGRHVWLIDPVGRSAFSSLKSTLLAPDVTKILHSVGEDLEVFRILTGALPQPLFDTQIAAAMLGNPLQCRYEHLVEQCFGVQLAGGQARSNWCRRPLAPALLEYAAQDVVWLPRLHEWLSEALERSGRRAWLQEDCRRLVEKASGESQGQLVLRVKGAGRLGDTELAWLDRLARWREGEAQRRDLPRGFVVRDEALLELAARASRSDSFEHSARCLPRAIRNRYEADLKRLLEGGPDETFQRPPELRQLTTDQRQAIKQAQQVVREQAESLGLDPALIASKRELTRLVRGERPDWLDGWRGELIGHLAAD